MQVGLRCGFMANKMKKRRVRHPQKFKWENVQQKRTLHKQKHQAHRKRTAKMKIVCIGAGYVGGEHPPNTAGFPKMFSSEVAALCRLLCCLLLPGSDGFEQLPTVGLAYEAVCEPVRKRGSACSSPPRQSCERQTRAL